MKKKTIFIILGALVIVVLLVFTLTSDGTKKIEVVAAGVEARDIIEKVTASGRVEPKTKVDITAEINGEIMRMAVEEGDDVSTGQLLLVLDTVQLRSDVDQALYNVNEVNARLEGAKAALDQADEDYERQKRLFDQTLTSETALNDAHYAFLSAKANAKATEAQAKQAQFRYEKQLDYLSKATIASPMEGVVTFVDCEVGEIAPAQTAFTQGKTLMTISDLSVFEVEVEVDETEINKIELWQQVDIEVDAFPDTTFEGEVVEIGNTAIVSRAGTQDQATNFKVKVVFKDSNVRVRPGMSATVDVTTQERDDAVAIPFSAVVIRSFDLDSLRAARSEEATAGTTLINEAKASDNPDENEHNLKKKKNDKERKELKGVFVIRDGVARFEEIETGVADQKFIEVTSGLEAGDSVISGPYKLLRTIKDGDNVEAKSDEDEG